MNIFVFVISENNIALVPQPSTKAAQSGMTYIYIVLTEQYDMLYIALVEPFIRPRIIVYVIVIR